jgi:hypothetical protein
MNAIDYQAYINAINLAKQALKFYASSDSYEENITYGYNLTSRIELDKGHQAKYVLDLIEKLIKEDYANIEKELKQTLKDETFYAQQEFEINKALKSMVSIVDDVKEQYDELLNSGLFFEKFPNLSGDWEIDKYEFTNKMYK